MIWNYNVLSAKFWLVLFTQFILDLSTPLISKKREAQTLHRLKHPLWKSLAENKILFLALQTSFVVKAAWDITSLLSTGQLTVLKTVIPIATTSLFWTHNYTLSQRLIGSFSPSWNHHTFSIFRDRGAPVKSVGTRHSDDPDSNSTFQDVAFSDCSTAFWKAHSPTSFEAASTNRNTNQIPHGSSAAKHFWTNFLGKDREKIDPSNAHEKDLYNQFRDDVLADMPAIKLLKLPQNPSRSDVIQAYKTYSMVLYPDRNTTRWDEATVLFKCLGRAKFQLIGD